MLFYFTRPPFLLVFPGYSRCLQFYLLSLASYIYIYEHLTIRMPVCLSVRLSIIVYLTYISTIDLIFIYRTFCIWYCKSASVFLLNYQLHLLRITYRKPTHFKVKKLSECFRLYIDMILFICPQASIYKSNGRSI